MSIECPSCQFVIKLKGVKAGRYSPKCPKCAKTFALTVSGDEGSYHFSAKALEAKAPAAKAAPVVAPPKPPPPEKDPETAAIDHVEEDIESTSGYLGGEAPSNAVAKTEVHDEESDAISTKTVTGEDDDADFDVDGERDEGKEKPPDEEEEDIPKTLGGYEIIEQLGRGGMGTVYLARQVSLDRPVALKVMNPRWASDPVFVARFTREAYAAAQLVHHNVVQIYDIGQHKGVQFFSMEYVKGQTLADLVREKKKLNVEEAVGYILQAARGLKAAHDQGMVHRDVKPDNLMLNDLGVVKVADLGLVKTPGASEPEQVQQAKPSEKKAASHGSLSSMPSVTNVGSAMGTPSYMAPEQGINAATVDHRADIYSLGCTLYVMVTGRAPFRGKTALEVLTKHLKEKPIPPEVIAKRVPKEISALVLRMMAKKPQDRHADMNEVIADMEKFLGVSRVGPFTPSEEHADTLEQCVNKFNNAPAAKLRRRAIPLFYLACAVGTVLSSFLSLRLAGGVIGFALMTALFTFLARGLSEKTHLFLQVRDFILGSGLSDWLTWGAGLLLFGVLLYMTGLLTYWLGFLVLSGAAAGTIRVLIDKPLTRQRKAPIEKAEKLLRGLRLKGLQEEAVRQFVCKYSGEHWEEFFEALFGYMAMLSARRLWSRPEGGKARPMYATWRDPLVIWIDARQRARKEAREKKHLKELERAKLQAEGVSASEAKQQAEEAAEVMVSAAAEIKQQAASPDELPSDAALVPLNAGAMIRAAEKPKELPPEIKKKLQQKPITNPIAVALGGKTRFLVGGVLLLLCFLWMNQNDLIPGGETNLTEYQEKLATAKDLTFLPAPIDMVFSGWTAGVAGLILVMSSLAKSRPLIFFLLLSVGLLLTGPLFMPDVLGVQGRYVTLLAGLAMAEFGVVFNRAAKLKRTH